jgi:uncharacterized protein with PQ loop repeat
MKIVHKNTQKKKLLDKLTFLSGILLPLATLPQVYDIWVSKQTAGVSLATWSFYLVTSTLFAIFGIKHKEKLLIWTYTPFVIIEAAIIAGLIIFR